MGGIEDAMNAHNVPQESIRLEGAKKGERELQKGAKRALVAGEGKLERVAKFPEDEGNKKESIASKAMKGWPKDLEAAKVSEDRASQEKVGKYSVTAENVNFRNEKGEVVAKVGKSQNSEIIVVENNRYKIGDHYFAKAYLNGQPGFVAADYLYFKEPVKDEYIAALKKEKPDRKAAAQAALDKYAKALKGSEGKEGS